MGKSREKEFIGLSYDNIKGPLVLSCFRERRVYWGHERRSGASKACYFEKGCRKKCARQSRKVLWEVLGALFFKEIWKTGTRGHGHMFASAKGKQQKYVRQLQSSGTVYWSYPILSLGIVACTFFPTTVLEIAVYVACFKRVLAAAQTRSHTIN